MPETNSARETIRTEAKSAITRVGDSHSYNYRMKGQCKLCLRENVDLRRSHFLPAAAYRILSDRRFKNPNPIMITDSAALQSSWQQREPLLCNDCEQRFHRNGENWIFSKCLRRDGNFPLRDLLIARTADAGQGGATQVYLAAKIPEIDINALIYFGTSMFWRGSIHSWNSDGI